ncbi:MAG: ribonuclease R [Candidatus Woesearchaeota archaeon]
MYQTTIIKYLFSENYISSKLEDFYSLDININNQDLTKFLDKLIDLQIISFKKENKTYLPHLDIVAGYYERINQYFGFIRPFNNQLPDLYIYYKNANNALHGDIVIAKKYVSSKGKNNNKEEGTIIFNTESTTKKIVGRLQKYKSFGFVTPITEHFNDIYIPSTSINNAKDKQIVVAEITERNNTFKNKHTGKIVEILGYDNDIGIDVLKIVKEYDMPIEFPSKVIEEALNIPKEISKTEIKNELHRGRVDLRKDTIITIDGESTRDYDDAISIKKTKDNNYLLSVHIADVSHYVKENSALDNEAKLRGTSVYLTDRVIPMLPADLSNGICSLNPHKDRFTLTCSMKIDNSGQVIESNVFESIINTTERMTYQNIKKLIRKEDKNLTQNYSHIVKYIDLFYELSIILQKKKESEGFLDLNISESKIILDKNNKPIDIQVREQDEATKLIESFMILCNEIISETYFKLKLPFLYRVHEKPKKEKIHEFLLFLKTNDIEADITDFTPLELQKLINQLSEHPEQKELVSTIMLRSLQKAKYSVQALGHFGLGSKYYSHFTSPIRRYPDLQIHRIIKDYLHGKMNKKRISHYQKILNDIANNCTKAEIKAFKCEKDTKNYKKCEYMLEKIDNIYPGVISGITEKGVFVKIPHLLIEGFILKENLNTEDSYFIFDKEKMCYIETIQNIYYTIGTPITIKVIDVDLNKIRITFDLV